VGFKLILLRMENDCGLDTDSSDSELDYQIQEMVLESENNPREPDPDQHQEKLDFRMDRLPPPEVRSAMDGRGNMMSQNTGPKGVLEDYKEAQLHVATERMRNEMRNQRAIQKMAEGEKKVFVQESIPIEDQLKAAKAAKDSDDSDSDSDLGLDDSDDEAFQKYKLQQIKMVQNSLPSYGAYERMETNEQFARAIHSTHELVYIVAHLYQNHIAHCTRLHLCFESLAAQFHQIRFVRIKATEAIKGYKDIGLPAIMIYRGGKNVQSYVRVHEDKEIGKNITDMTVAHWLSKKGVMVLPGNEFYDQVKPKASGPSIRGGTEEASDDEY